MYPEFTTAQLLNLLDIQSSADYQAVFDAVQCITIEPLSWDAPGDDAEYITSLIIGGMNDPKNVGVTFSKHGNLSYAYLPNEPLIAVSAFEPILKSCGWTLVSPDIAKKVLYPLTGATVHDCFFSYT